MLTISKTNHSISEELRRLYLSSLPEFQELYLEIMVQDSDCYLLKSENETAGYAIVNSEKVLIEFFLYDKFVTGSSEIFKLVISKLSVKEVYCKSFDYLLLNCCLLQGWSYILLGCLYRYFQETSYDKYPVMRARQAVLSDIPIIRKQSEDIHELFETEEQLNQFVGNNNVFLFFIDNQLAGCGMVIRVHPDWEYHDLGVWVNPDFRGRSLGTQIIRWLREYSLNNGWKPTCGCAFDNIASRKTLEKSGFFSRHSLICFHVS